MKSHDTPCLKRSDGVLNTGNFLCDVIEDRMASVLKQNNKKTRAVRVSQALTDGF